MAKMYQLGIRADARTRERWARKAKKAGLSLNKWALFVLNNAPDAKLVVLSKHSSASAL
jgi:predicted HicB family RNase H-like nuclease